MRSFPIFGQTAARKWLWAFDLSPAYIGYGIIIDPNVNICTLFGAIVRWGVLAPIAKHKGWAPGHVNDWDNGSRGWILWVGMGLILGDSAVSLIWTITKPTIPWFRLGLKRYHSERSSGQQIFEHDSFLGESLDVRLKGMEDKLAIDDDWSRKSRITMKLLLYTGSGFLLLYIILIFSVFRQYLTVLATFVAILLVPLAAFVSMRSLGETDNGTALAIGMLSFLLPKAILSIEAKYNYRQSGITGYGASCTSIKSSSFLYKPTSRWCCRDWGFTSFTTNGWFEDSIHDTNPSKGCLLCSDYWLVGRNVDRHPRLQIVHLYLGSAQPGIWDS